MVGHTTRARSSKSPRAAGLTTIYTFCANGCSDGASPGSLIQSADGELYGTTYVGGAKDDGTVFKITPSGSLTTLYSFCAQSGCTDGQDPLDWFRLLTESFTG